MLIIPKSRVKNKPGRQDYEHHLKKRWARKVILCFQRPEEPRRAAGLVQAEDYRLASHPLHSCKATAPRNRSKCKLSVMANFICQLTSHMVLRLNIIFARVWEWVSLNVISIWVSGLSQVDCPPCRGWASSNSLRLNETKGRGMELASFACQTAWCGTPVIFSDLPSLASQAFWTSKLNYMTGFPRHPHNKCLYLLLVLFLENPY